VLEPWPLLCVALTLQNAGSKGMKPSYFAYVAFVGVLSFLILFIADRKAGVDQLAEFKIPHTALEDPSLKQMSTHGPYMRTER
jgi:hypothetical protein